MKLISRNELSKYKILPFNLYNETGDIVIKAGEVLTVGRVLQLKKYDKLFKEEVGSVSFSEEKKDNKQQINNTEDLSEDFNYDSISISEYDTPVNQYSKIDVTDQIKIKTYLVKTIEILKDTGIQQAFPKIANLGNIITEKVIPKFSEIEHYSELRFLGEYEVCHPINVAIMSGMIAKKMNFSEEFISDIILAGICHDIGKYRIKNAFMPANSLTSNDAENIKSHTIVGYNILKNELKLPEHICNVALQHHENNDGTGYPHGISSDWISIESQIVNVCNCYDNFAFNKTGYVVKNNRDVMRLMLSIGTSKFSAEILYKFAHMYSYNDTVNFDDMSSKIS